MKTPRLREWREAMGETQVTLAERSGVAEHTISRIEHGASLRPSTARKLADALGVAVTDLMESPPVPAAGKAGAPQESGPQEDKAPDVPMPGPSGHAIQVDIAEGRGATRVEITRTSFFELARDLKAGRLSEEDAWQRFQEEAG